MALLCQRRSSAGDRESALRTAADRDAFLRWFTFLAEAQYFTPMAQRSGEIVDCSSLIRYAYREALRLHDAAWARIPSVELYNYPRTPTGAKLFRTGPTTFGEFADAQTLCRYNAHLVNRDLGSAHSGDLVFYRHSQARSPFHCMILLGPSQMTPSSQRFVVYHTGPDGTTDGGIKRLTFEELLHFPDARWQPIDRNPAFLGVFRWKLIDRLS